METIQDRDKYDLVEVLQEIDHELAMRAVDIIRCRAEKLDEGEIRRLLVRYKIAMQRNIGLLDDVIKGLGTYFE